MAPTANFSEHKEISKTEGEAKVDITKTTDGTKIERKRLEDKMLLQSQVQSVLPYYSTRFNDAATKRVDTANSGSVQNDNNLIEINNGNVGNNSYN